MAKAGPYAAIRVSVRAGGRAGVKSEPQGETGVAGAFVLSPHTLLSGLKIAGPSNPICVEGSVESVRPHLPSRSAYVTLSGGGATVDARVPIEEAPSVREVVRVSGMVGVQPRGVVGGGLSVVVFGRIEDAPDRPARRRVTLTKERRMSLESLLEQHPVETVLVLGTERAYSDLCSTGLRQQPRFMRVSTVAADEIVAAAELGIREGACAIVFTRGGSADGSEGIWNDSSFVARLLGLSAPYYTAIGHSDSLHLADSYADQAFTTPTHVGVEIRRILERRAARARVDAELARLRDRVRELERPAALVAAPAPFVRVRFPRTLQEWAIVAAAVVFLAILTFRSLR